MPPKSAEQKRKRGRPSNASRVEDASAQSPGAAEAGPNEQANEGNEAAKPSKRGRPSKRKETGPETEPAPSSPVDEPKSKKRGRPRREEVNEEDAPESAEPIQQKKRAKRTADGKEKPVDREGEVSPPAEKSTRGKPGRRPAKEIHEEEEARVDEISEANDAPKKKRGRPSKFTDNSVEEQPEEESEPVPKRKRGRPSLNKEPVTEEPEAAEEEAPPKKRGRKPKEKPVEVEEPAEEEATAEAAPKRRRRRPAAEAPEQPSPEREEVPVKKERGRPSLESQEEKMEASRLGKKASRGRKARQPSPASPAEEASTEKPTKKRRKRSSQGEEAQEPSPETQRRRPGRPRTSDASSAPRSPEEQNAQPRKSKKRPSGDASAEQSPPKKRRRRTSDEQQQQSRPEPPIRRPVPKYRHIAARTRQIPRSTIDEKWSPLAPSSISLVSNLLRLSERPVLQRLADNEKRQDQAASAIRLVANRVAKKISRGLPFPPASAPPRGASAGKKHNEDGGRAEELDFERVVEGVASLEKQLDPLLHAVELLRVEKEHDERALEEDYETLRTLEANARSEARNFKDSLRKTHVLVPEQKKDVAPGSDDGDFKFVPDVNLNGTIFRDLEDDELRGLAAQIGSHMESMRNNLQQVDGVVPQISRSRAALQDVLFKHLDQQNYENVLFG